MSRNEIAGNHRILFPNAPKIQGRELKGFEHFKNNYERYLGICRMT